MQKYSLQNADIIVPFRGADQERCDNLDMMLGYIYQNFDSFQIILVEVDEASKIGPHWSNLDNLSHVLIENTGLFPLALARNYGAKLGKSDIILMWDVDMIPNPYTVSFCVQELKANGRKQVFNPFGSIYNVCDAEREAFRHTLNYEILQHKLVEENTHIRLLYQHNSGGMIIFRKEDFVALGGYNSFFLGWGGEDDECLIRFARLGVNWSKYDVPMFHLNHDSGVRYAKPDSYTEGVRAKFLNDLNSKPLDELRNTCGLLRPFFDEGGTLFSAPPL